jgi:hydrogenase nickel incorporation protein HypA/HybF
VHEYSIVQALVGEVAAQARRHGATAVGRIRVALGELSGVNAELLATAYDTFRPGTVCNGAEMDIRSVPASWLCPVCGRPIEAGAALRCPECSRPARLASGDEIVLERIEMEVP